MAKSEISELQRSDLNAFLYSDVGRERSGMTMSVVSLLARMGADPWREAGRLADLPEDAARESLAHTIVRTPSSTWSLPEAILIASRLVMLLPRRPLERVLPGQPAWRRKLALLFLAALSAAIVVALMHLGTS